MAFLGVGAPVGIFLVGEFAGFGPCFAYLLFSCFECLFFAGFWLRRRRRASSVT
jgi:hypothetical protein